MTTPNSLNASETVIDGRTTNGGPEPDLHAADESRVAHNALTAWSHGSVTLEHYRYAPGRRESVGRHCHPEYQLCLSLNEPGEYAYRGARRPVPVGALSVLQPGEPHAARDTRDRPHEAVYRTFLVPSAVMEAAVSDGRTVAPFFPDPVLMARDLFALFWDQHLTLTGDAPLLEREERLLRSLRHLAFRHAEQSPSAGPHRRERAAVRRAREYLEANLAESVPLERLAQVARLSPFHLCRVFHQEVGLPIHAYHTQARVGRAKGLLLQGAPIGEAAQETGFYDQSHLTRHFKRIVSVTPTNCRAAEDVQNGQTQHRKS